MLVTLKGQGLTLLLKESQRNIYLINFFALGISQKPNSSLFKRIERNGL